MTNSFRYRNALITGGSRGLGRALAAELARRDVAVVLVAREHGALAAAADAIRARGGRAHAIAADVGDPQAAARIAGEAAALVGPIELLVNGASTLGPVPLRELSDLEADDFGRVVEVNLLGPFRLTRAIAGGMALRGGGAVVNVSSDAAVNAYPTWGAYSATKAALDHLTRIWAAELGGAGVRFLAVDPGEMDTAMHAAAMPEADPATLLRPEAVAARIAELLASGAWDGGARLVAAEAQP